MVLHIKSQSVQLAATSCVYNLILKKTATHLPNYVGTQLINTIINTMKNFPNSLIVRCFKELILFKQDQLINGLKQFQAAKELPPPTTRR